MIGYLYIVSNPQMHGENCFKIGFTSDLKRRMEEFNSATINIGKFEHHGHIICKDVEIVEKRVHRDLEYFRAKLYRSLNVPASRLEASSGFNLGRSTEITRDELKFTKFVQRLRKKFTEIFNDVLRTQLVLKAVITDEDWLVIRDVIQYDFLQDGHFAELKDSEMLLERLRLADTMRDYVGRYFSVEYVRKKVLRQNEREIEDINNQIRKEIKDGIIADPMQQYKSSKDTIEGEY